MNVSREFIKYALDIGAIELIPEGRKLKSGRISPYFFNSALFTNGESLNVLLRAYWEAWGQHPLLTDAEVDVVFGPAYKGIPLATGLALLADGKGEILDYAFDRKEAKDHGEGGLIVGATLTDMRVIIIDDVMTSGISSAGAVEMVRQHGGVPVGALIAFDRQEIGKETEFSAVQEFEQKFQIPVAAAATLEELLEYLREIEHSIVPKIEEYRAQYGIFPNG